MYSWGCNVFLGVNYIFACNYWGQKLKKKMSQCKIPPVSTALLALHIYKTCFAHVFFTKSNAYL